ncbi:MAG: hypothetical protein CMM58_10990 [Rhodospirillaceae bacterium]|nr:hypothetical protein [Rhodospirillaceae bacterium]|tara:strand:+ start:790 stop:1827 length:1038 start_codon:yes stop_codon:yes gene_type:complete
MERLKANPELTGKGKYIANEVARLDRGDTGYAFPSYNSAISTILELVENGSHVIGFMDKSSVAYHIFENIRRRSAGLRFTYLDNINEEHLRKVIIDETSLVWVESIKTPFFDIPDLKMVGRVCRECNVISVSDNANATPHLVQPLNFGIDIVVEDARSFLVGLENVEAGFAVIAPEREFLREKLAFLHDLLGSYLGDMECSTVEKALKSFTERMNKSCGIAEIITDFLSSSNEVEEIYRINLEQDLTKAFHRKDVKKSGNSFSFLLEGDMERALRFKSKLKLFKPRTGSSMTAKGGTYWHPASELYGAVPFEIRSELGIPDGLFQLGVGLGNSDDLIEDLCQALI